MIYRIFVLCVVGMIMTACGGETPTQAPSTSPTQSTPADEPVSFAPPTTELTQTIVSETGVSYQLPIGWVVQDNESVSNFGSDEDAVLDFISNDSRNTRWLLIGNFGVADTSEITDLAGLTSVQQAAPLLSAYYYTETNPIVAPSIITLPNGGQAYFVINQDGDIFNVSYFLAGAEGVFITLFISGSEASINASRDLMVAIANSASYSQP